MSILPFPAQKEQGLSLGPGQGSLLIQDGNRGSEDADTAEVGGNCIPTTQDNVFRSFLSTLLPILFCEVEVQLPSHVKTSYRVDGEIPRDINCCLKSLQRTFFRLLY